MGASLTCQSSTSVRSDNFNIPVIRVENPSRDGTIDDKPTKNNLDESDPASNSDRPKHDNNKNLSTELNVDDNNCREQSEKDDNSMDNSQLTGNLINSKDQNNGQYSQSDDLNQSVANKTIVTQDNQFNADDSNSRQQEHNLDQNISNQMIRHSINAKASSQVVPNQLHYQIQNSPTDISPTTSNVTTLTEKYKSKHSQENNNLSTTSNNDNQARNDVRNDYQHNYSHYSSDMVHNTPIDYSCQKHQPQNNPDDKLQIDSYQDRAPNGQTLTTSVITKNTKNNQVEANVTIQQSNNSNLQGIVDRCWREIDQTRISSSNLRSPPIINRNGWQCIRIFVSSTFSDYHSEREILVKKVMKHLSLLIGC